MSWHPFSRWHLDPPYDDDADEHEDWEGDVPDHWWAEGGWADPEEIAFISATGDARELALAELQALTNLGAAKE